MYEWENKNKTKNENESDYNMKESNKSSHFFDVSI
jgi:hypothetical protein